MDNGRWRRFFPCAPILVVGAVAACGQSIDGGSTSSKLLDAVWCDVHALPCANVVIPGGGLPQYCEQESDTPVPATPPGGERICFDSTKTTPEAACAALCDDDDVLSVEAFPRNTAGSCSATINTDASAHADLNARGFRPSACTTARNESGSASAAGTNSVSLAGDGTPTGTATFDGATAGVVVQSGFFDISAPNTQCGALSVSCSVQINALEIDLGDFDVGGLSVRGLSFFLDGADFTPSGQLVPPELPIAPDPVFLFPVPPEMAFDAIGTFVLDGETLGGFALRTPTELQATLDLVTGAMVVEFSFQWSFGDRPFTISGAAFTGTVIDWAPVIAPPPALSVAVGDSCAVDTTLTASATSPVGLPVTVRFVVDDGAGVLDGPTASTTLYGVGTHVISILAADSLGGMTTATQTITATGPSTCGCAATCP